jgi:hypothetical protein
MTLTPKGALLWAVALVTGLISETSFPAAASSVTSNRTRTSEPTTITRDLGELNTRLATRTSRPNN